MDCDKYEIRVLLRHYFKQKYKAAVAAKKICDIKGEDVVNERMAQRWFQRFKNGDLTLEDRARSGRPPIWDIATTKETVENEPCTSTRKLSDMLGPSKDTIHRHLKSLGKSYRSCRIVPHELTEFQAQRRVEICKHLLTLPKDDRFIKQIVACDEKWIYLNNPDMTNQWLDKRELPKPVVKRERFESKVLLCVWWNYDGLVYFELLPDGRAITAAVYSEQLTRMYEILLQKYPGLVNRKRVLLQQDNARPHTARVTMNKIAELGGIELLPHPAFSPDLAPSDYYLFRSMAKFFRGKKFTSVEEVENAVRDFFNSKPKEWFYIGLKELADRWVKTVEYNGLYVEC